MSLTFQALHCSRLSLVRRCTAVISLPMMQSLQVLTYAQFCFLQISELALMKQSKNSLQLPKPTRNTRKISNLLMTIASGEISLQSKQDIICHVTKVKAATSAHSVAQVIPLF